jgi:hypothetical protein
MYDNLLEQLKHARAESKLQHEYMKNILENAKLTDLFVMAEQSAAGADAAILDLETQIKNTAISEFNTTGEKKVHPKVEVKIFKKFSIVSPARVLAWVKTNLADALVFDEKKVKNYATKIGPVEGTELVDEPRAQIAAEL